MTDRTRLRPHNERFGFHLSCCTVGFTRRPNRQLSESVSSFTARAAALTSAYSTSACSLMLSTCAAQRLVRSETK
jgi:hypothetical protein